MSVEVITKKHLANTDLSESRQAASEAFPFDTTLTNHAALGHALGQSTDTSVVALGWYPHVIGRGVNQILRSHDYDSTWIQLTLAGMIGGGPPSIPDGDEHTRQHQFLAQTLSSARVKAHLDSMSAGVESSMSSYMQNNNNPDVANLAATINQNVVADAILHYTLPEEDRARVAQAGSKLFKFAMELLKLNPAIIPATLDFFSAKGTIREVADGAMANAQRILAESGGKLNDDEKDLAIRIVEAAQKGSMGASAEELRELMQITFVAGQNPIVISVTNSYFHLLKNPDVYNQVREELEGITNKDDHYAYILNPDSLLSLIPEESGRITPPIAYLFRRRVAEGEDEFGLHKGKTAILNLPATGMNQQMYGEDVFKFNPTRFLRDGVSKSFMYGGGFRVCPGANIGNIVTRLTLANMIMSGQQIDPVSVEDNSFVTDKTHVSLQNKLRIRK